MNRDVDAVICQPLGGSCERNHGGDTAVGKEDLAILAGEIGVQAFPLGGSVGVDCDGVPVVTYFGLWRTGGGVAVADDFCIVAIDPKAIRQFTYGIVAYARKPFAKADRGIVGVTEFFLAPIDGAGGLTPV